MKTVINLQSEAPVMPEFPEYGICILESHHKTGFLMPPSHYDFSEVMLILAGRGWVITGQTKHPVRKHDLLMISKGTSYYFEDGSEPIAMLCLCIRPPAALKEVMTPVLPTKFKMFRHPILAKDVSSHLRAIYFEQSQSRRWSGSVIIGQTLLLLSKLARRTEGEKPVELKSPSSGMESIIRVKDYIAKLESAFHEAETTESAASRLRISYRSLTHHFRDVTGMSRLKYIQQLRLQHAKHLLAESSDSVTSIAFACGFEDLSNFFRIFRATEGLTATQWREKHTAGRTHQKQTKNPQLSKRKEER